MILNAFIERNAISTISNLMLRYRGVLRYGISNTVNAEEAASRCAATLYYRYIIVVNYYCKCRHEKLYRSVNNFRSLYIN